MAQKNNNLNKAKSAKNDEFYTMLSDIENELKHYKNQFRDKVIYCNCDDARQSNFFKYFSLNFEFLGLKKLISTSYNENGKGTILVYEGDTNGNHQVDDDEILVQELEGNGDFRSSECIKLLDEADIIVTNPPFSLFREFFAIMMEFNKKFIILGNNNAITYKEIFPYIKEGKLWLGHQSNKTLSFVLPNDYEKWDKVENGKKIGNVPAISWFTNLETNKFVDAPTLFKTYNETDYPKYDNYNAINVNKVAEIPYDYPGVIGVPITIIDKVCSDGLIHFDTPMLENADSKYQIVGLTSSSRDNANNIIYNESTTTKASVNGKEIYARVLIKKIID